MPHGRRDAVEENWVDGVPARVKSAFYLFVFVRRDGEFGILRCKAERAVL